MRIGVLEETKSYKNELWAPDRCNMPTNVNETVVIAKLVPAQ